ncbi:1-(5-phosphoribosyl)-5-[(5-phosphoribosylamino)methylideneamino]imidazole-4-carboxamide isomerase [Liquorilactobacillus mali]|uniref:1-(5-phosphoribosyl)-5-[(5-phosphoribosylamino)methylideneamino] imidazole-4-carboxamide isomerase n=1 Tax=Liquorilactobacillus mali TaxID=1618 RepID=A0A0R2FJW6_9LACO|nr:1-(5-phosphoribosyl)-5-[(5-phosphoribosylamino)methylideneamino]imidazole-4-carboxamide isomerase [Liquorilactobacillus mali]KRN28558.1 phosphoribosylformimino-5-aminoimidazole carboxamideribotide isomerase [Liquorilactobacillus mali]MDN7146205.1 1-(5-phosphoribosyl)-5-[(5-phosphoribosylamino)methylideneamino]imidazole-4-carboxamide isomerase [Liquorilactobacillus mali]
MIFPAIDLKSGKSVRLYKGDFAEETLIEETPALQAQKYQEAGIKCLHLVDLDGALKGTPQNETVIKDIRKVFTGLIEIGGGIRDLSRVKHYLDLGIDRVIIGSAALFNPEFVVESLKKFGADRIVIGVDGTNELVAVNGWLDTSDTKMETLIAKMEQAGARNFIVTDVQRDGTMNGPNVELLKKLKKSFNGCNIIASGGIRDIEDVKILAAAGLKDMVVGKSLFEGRLTLEEIAEVNDNAG